MNKELHSLRGLAIIMIVLLHSGVLYRNDFHIIYDWITSHSDTETGVELLFVLAGFFLSKGLLKSKNENGIKSALKETGLMFKKKVLRLLPATFFWSLIPLILSITIHDGVWLTPEIMIGKFISSFLFIRNFTEGNHPSAFGYMWAVALEMQYFIVFTFTFHFLGKRNTFLIACLIIFINTFYRIPNNENMFMFRFDSLLGGYVTYVILEKIKPLQIEKIKLSHFTKACMATLLIMSLATCARYFDSVRPFMFSAATFISMTIVLIATLELEVFSFIESKILSYIADRSYSLYCCHIPSWFIIISIYKSLNLDQSYMWIVQLLAMCIFTELTYRYIENITQFFKKWKKTE